MYDSGRRHFWQGTPGKAENKRFTVDLVEPSNEFFNEVWYRCLVKDETSTRMSSSTTEDSFHDYDYEEESYIDNSIPCCDSFPRGFKTEFGGYYVNSGKLKLVPITPEIKPKKIAEKKKFPDLRKMIKRKRNDKHREIMRELKKMKFSLPTRA